MAAVAVAASASLGCLPMLRWSRKPAVKGAGYLPATWGGGAWAVRDAGSMSPIQVQGSDAVAGCRVPTCHMGWWCVGGRRGYDTGLQPAAVMMRSASRKLRNREAIIRSCGAGGSGKALLLPVIYDVMLGIFGILWQHVFSQKHSTSRILESFPPHRSEQLLEHGPRQHVPRNGVCDGGEDPVELAQGGLAVGLGQVGEEFANKGRRECDDVAGEGV